MVLPAGCLYRVGVIAGNCSTKSQRPPLSPGVWVSELWCIIKDRLFFNCCLWKSFRKKMSFSFNIFILFLDPPYYMNGNCSTNCQSLHCSPGLRLQMTGALSRTVIFICCLWQKSEKKCHFFFILIFLFSFWTHHILWHFIRPQDKSV